MTRPSTMRGFTGWSRNGFHATWRLSAMSMALRTRSSMMSPGARRLACAACFRAASASRPMPTSPRG
jgi:hypothetical protein